MSRRMRRERVSVVETYVWDGKERFDGIVAILSVTLNDFNPSSAANLDKEQQAEILARMQPLLRRELEALLRDRIDNPFVSIRVEGLSFGSLTFAILFAGAVAFFKDYEKVRSGIKTAASDLKAASEALHKIAKDALEKATRDQESGGAPRSRPIRGDDDVF